MPSVLDVGSVKKTYDNIVYGLQLNILLSWIQLGPSYDHQAKTTDEQKLLTKKAILEQGLPSSGNFGLTANHAAISI